MPQKESRASEKFSLFNPIPAEFAGVGKKQIEDFLDQLQDTNRHWFDRAQSEASLGAELVSRLTAARSIPDAITACQEWTTRRFELMAEDGKHLLADIQKFVETSTRLMSNGWLSKGGGTST